MLLLLIWVKRDDDYLQNSKLGGNENGTGSYDSE
jgi:hypothetical protein